MVNYYLVVRYLYDFNYYYCTDFNWISLLFYSLPMYTICISSNAYYMYLFQCILHVFIVYYMYLLCISQCSCHLQERIMSLSAVELIIHSCHLPYIAHYSSLKYQPPAVMRRILVHMISWGSVVKGRIRNGKRKWGNGEIDDRKPLNINNKRPEV